jgi:hypothetical protein
MKMEQTECSETLAYKIQMPGNYPEESIQHSECGESLKSRVLKMVACIRNSSEKSYTYLKSKTALPVSGQLLVF